MLLNPSAPFALAREFHRAGVPLADVFTFASGLYFRGKIAYANRFAHPETGDVVRVITSNAGLADPGTIVHPADIAAFGAIDIDPDDERYHGPLRRDASKLSMSIGPGGTAVLLGSIATPKYREVLLEVFGSRLVFPTDFVGRGDMSRGALLLRCARAGTELPYSSVMNAVLTGRRASKVSDTRKPS